MTSINEIIAYIQNNPVIAVVGAGLALLIAGCALRRSKLIAIPLIAAASFVFYILLSTDKVGKVKIDEIKKKVKNKVMENL
jgi:hypothetical protein